MHQKKIENKPSVTLSALCKLEQLKQRYIESMRHPDKHVASALAKQIMDQPIDELMCCLGNLRQSELGAAVHLVNAILERGVAAVITACSTEIIALLRDLNANIDKELTSQRHPHAALQMPIDLVTQIINAENNSDLLNAVTSAIEDLFKTLYKHRRKYQADKLADLVQKKMEPSRAAKIASVLFELHAKSCTATRVRRTATRIDTRVKIDNHTDVVNLSTANKDVHYAPSTGSDSEHGSAEQILSSQQVVNLRAHGEAEVKKEKAELQSLADTSSHDQGCVKRFKSF